MKSFLSVTKPVVANVLLIEGWMLDPALIIASNEFRTKNYEFIVTTGLQAPVFYKMPMNGNLVFYTDNKTKQNKDLKKHKIEVELYGDTRGEERAHFNFFVNDSIVGDHYAGTLKKKYQFKWYGRISDIDSIIIQFDNDRMNEHVDRNLYIKRILIDHEIEIPYAYNTVYRVNTSFLKETRINDYSTYAEMAKLKLIILGIDSSKILAVPNRNTSINRTLATALDVRDYLLSNNIKFKGINIMSAGPHARRTWITYKSILHQDNGLHPM